MAILSEHVARYLERARPERSPLMAGMEELADRDGIPIVQWVTGRFLAALVRALHPERVLEVGTAIGYSTLHMAEQLDRGQIVTLEIDPGRAEQARGYLEAAGVAERVQLVEGDALETLAGLDRPFELLFLDAAKDQYRRYLDLAEPLLAERAVLVVDNVLMSGEVALGSDAGETFWAPEKLEGARALNAELLESSGWVAAVLPIGDGVTFATRR